MFIFYSDNDQGDTLPVDPTSDLFSVNNPSQGDILSYDGSHFTNTNILSGSNIDLINIDPNNLTGTIPYARLPNLAEITLSGNAVPPYIASITPITPTGTQNIEIIGEYFSPITQLNIPGVTVNSLEVRSPNKIIANISKSGLSGNKIITLANGANTNQIWDEGIKSLNIISDPYFSNVVFFLQRNLIDSKSKPVTLFGDVSVSAEQAKYGGSSIKFTRGLANFLSIPASNDFIFPADFTIETWIRWDGVETAGGAVLIATGGAGSQDQLGIFSGGLLGYGSLSNPFNISANIWHHIAISRSAGIVKGFLNGIQRYSISNNSSIGSNTNTLFIGRRSDNHPWGGFVDTIRITKGMGRYTVNFNPETDTYLNI